MKSMIKKTKPGAVDLSKIHRLLLDEFGEKAPSYPTLRRWVDDGVLTKARRGSEDGGRPLYAYSAVRLIYERTPHASRVKGAATAVVSQKGRPSKGSESVAPVEDKMVSALPDDVVQTMSQDIATIRNAVANLAVVQRNLAAKYDAVNTQLVNENERLKAELSAAKRSAGGGDSIIELAKISRGLSQLNDRVSMLSDLVESRQG